MNAPNSDTSSCSSNKVPSNNLLHNNNNYNINKNNDNNNIAKKSICKRKRKYTVIDKENFCVANTNQSIENNKMISKKKIKLQHKSEFPSYGLDKSRQALEDLLSINKSDFIVPSSRTLLVLMADSDGSETPAAAASDAGAAASTSSAAPSASAAAATVTLRRSDTILEVASSVAAMSLSDNATDGDGGAAPARRGGRGGPAGSRRSAMAGLHRQDAVDLADEEEAGHNGASHDDDNNNSMAYNYNKQ